MATRLVRSTYNITAREEGAVVTIGNFDGVHLGHQGLIKRVVDCAHAHHAPSLIITFEPHPFEFFHQHDLTIPRLTRLREKFHALSKNHVDNVLVLKFNQAFANLKAAAFVEDILVNQLHTKHVILGDDFRFGHEREGDFALMEKLGHKFGFSVEAMPTVMQDGQRISSTRVRDVLKAGDLKGAKALLGRPYTMQGRVRGGDQLGRALGFPTANIYLHRKLAPIQGVFIVFMHGISDRKEPGVANVGVRPTVGGTETLLEVHLLDFNGDLYGRYVEVEFCEKLREEIRYQNLDLLKEQIAKDVDSARNYFNMTV
jgi:riboflavin kinase/FMN adenylyltransferase